MEGSCLLFFPQKGRLRFVMWSWWQGTHFLQRFFDVLKKHRTNVRTVSPSLLLKRLCWYSIVESAEKQKMWVSTNSSLKIFFVFHFSKSSVWKHVKKEQHLPTSYHQSKATILFMLILIFFELGGWSCAQTLGQTLRGWSYPKRAQDLFHWNSMTILFSLHMAHDFILEVQG